VAIMAVGAIVGAGAVTAGVAASTVALVSIGVTVVGMVTKSKELTKLGAGLGVGSAAASFLGLGSSAAATTAAETAAAASVEAAAEGGNIAANAAADAAAQSAAEAAVQSAPAQVGASGIEPASQAMTGVPDVAPSSLAPPAAPASPAAAPASAPIDSASQTMTGVPDVAPSGTIAEPAKVDYGLVEGASRGQGIRPPADAMSVKPTTNAMPTLERGSTWFDRISRAWTNLGDKGQAAVLTVGGQMISGVGQGLIGSMAKQDERDFYQRQLDERRARLAGVPNLTPFARPA